MRSLTLHPLSLVAGVVLTGMAFISMSQLPPLNARSLNIEYVPHPRDMVQITEGTQYTVPGGKIFVLTALGASGFVNANCDLAVNGVNKAEVFPGTPSGYYAGHSMLQIPNGLTVAAGSQIDVSGGAGGNDTYAWGYLADQ